MKKSDFNKAVKNTRLKSTAIAMARDVLCNNLTQTQAGVNQGCSQNAARQAVVSVMREHKKRHGYPADWVEVTVTVPPDIVETIRLIADDAASSLY